MKDRRLHDGRHGRRGFALYPTGFSGVSEEPPSQRAREQLAARKALKAIEQLVTVGRATLPDGLPFGASLHTGEVYIGTVRGAEEGIFDVRVWGAEVNEAARLCSAAAAGEALVSDGAADLLGLDAGRFEQRELMLRGSSRASKALVLTAASAAAARL